MSITRNFNLYLNAGHSIPLVINASQYDQGEIWNFTLYEADGTQYTPTTGAIVGCKSDGNLITNAGTVDANGCVVITETEQMTAAAGKNVFELQIENDTHGTANFVILVEESPLDNGTVSESDLSLIQQAIDSTNPQVITAAVNDWLDEHPEATTTVADGAITTAKLADHAVTLAKSDFYYTESKIITPSWMTVAGGEGVNATITFPLQSLATASTDMPDTVSVVCKVNTQYWTQGEFLAFNTRNNSWQYQGYTITHTNSTLTVNNQMYAVMTFTKADWQSAYSDYLTAIEGGLIGYSCGGRLGNVSGRFDDAPFIVNGSVTAELIENGFSEAHLSSDFADAVQYVIATDSGTSPEEEEAKTLLSGKVMICLGDSYTVGMGSLLSTLATKYEMVLDNRGVVSSAITGTSSSSPYPFWYRSDAIITDYTNGYTIGETSYTASDVGIIVFMGGANDGFGVETYIGTGIHETDKTKIYGACGHIFNTLAETFTGAKYICITQPSNYVRSVSDISDDATAQTLGFENLAELQSMTDVQFSNYAMAHKEEAVKNSAWAYGWSILDMFHEFPTVFNSANRSAYWSSDKLHLTSDGYTLISEALDKKIVEVVVE